MTALRNFLSHQSVGSRKKLKDSINSLTEKTNDHFKSNFRQIGPYLKGDVHNNISRAELIVHRLKDLSNKL
jgi:hypothetical protein